MPSTKPNEKKKSKQPKTVRRKPPQRSTDQRMVSAWVDKKIAHSIKLEAAKLNMPQSEFIRYVVKEALKNDKLKPPMNEL